MQISSTSYDFENTYVTSSTEMTTAANHALVAEWIPNNVILDANGGTMTGASSKYLVKGETYGALPTPTREGYTFAGWKIASVQNLDVDIEAGTSNFKYSIIKRNIAPGTTYTIYIKNAKVVSGSSSQFDILMHNYTTNESVPNSCVTTSFGDNLIVTITCSTTESSSSDIRLLLYSGRAGKTAGMTTQYTGINITQSTDETVTSSTVYDSTESVTLLATWIKN